MEEYAAAVSAVLFDRRGKILLLNPERTDAPVADRDPASRKDWQVVSGKLEDDSLEAGIARELREELGDITFRIVDVIDAHTFRYRERSLISVFFLVEYLGGEIIPGDDVAGYDHAWFSPEEARRLHISRPRQSEILEKAYFLLDIYLERDFAFFKYNWSDPL